MQERNLATFSSMPKRCIYVQTANPVGHYNHGATSVSIVELKINRIHFGLTKVTSFSFSS